MRISDWSSDVCSSDLRIDGDVVVRRPDAAGGEDIIVACAQIVDRLDDRRRPIPDDPHLDEADALRTQPRRDLGDVPILRTARENGRTSCRERVLKYV